MWGRARGSERRLGTHPPGQQHSGTGCASTHMQSRASWGLSCHHQQQQGASRVRQGVPPCRSCGSRVRPGRRQRPPACAPHPAAAPAGRPAHRLLPRRTRMLLLALHFRSLLRRLLLRCAAPAAHPLLGPGAAAPLALSPVAGGTLSGTCTRGTAPRTCTTRSAALSLGAGSRTLHTGHL
jgi:hypothetical protein